MTYTDPVWFWRATFTDGTSFTFYADSKALARDHAAYVGRVDVGKTLADVTRLKHAKDVTADELAAAGTVR
jgi:hypothetical protein